MKTRQAWSILIISSRSNASVNGASDGFCWHSIVTVRTGASEQLSAIRRHQIADRRLL